MGSDEHVVPYDLDVQWEPNTSDPLLVQQGSNAMLFVAPHFDDPDQRQVVIRVQGCRGVVLAGPNDEARNGHRLWDRGLRDCLWAAEVLDSEWITEQVRVNSVHPRHDQTAFEGLRHWILLFKEATAECLGTSLQVQRPSKPMRIADSA